MNFGCEASYCTEELLGTKIPTDLVRVLVSDRTPECRLCSYTSFRARLNICKLSKGITNSKVLIHVFIVLTSPFCLVSGLNRIRALILKQ